MSEDAEELYLDFAKIATGLEGYVFPPTLIRSAIATILVDYIPGGMIRAVLISFLAMGVLPKAPTIPPDLEQKSLTYDAFDNIRNIDRRIDENPMQKNPRTLQRNPASPRP